jgi:rubrerythrin
MAMQTDKSMEMFCTVLEMKEKKRALYQDAMQTCPDQVGVETFRMLRDAEAEHLSSIQKIYEEIKQGKVWVEACAYHPIEDDEKKAILRKIAEQHGKMPRACLDDVVAIETGMHLENASVSFFEQQLQRQLDPTEREFVDRMIEEENAHYVLLADLKYYYTDPQSWFMEKSRARLDGAGGGT